MNGGSVTGVSARSRNPATFSMVYQQFINYPNLTVSRKYRITASFSQDGEKEVDSRVPRNR